MKFKLDENLPAEAAQYLSEVGFDAMSVLDQGLGGAADARLARICKEEDRVLLTFDLDFANTRSYPPGEHAGLIVFRLPTQERRSFLDVLARRSRHLKRAHRTASCGSWRTSGSGCVDRGSPHRSSGVEDSTPRRRTTASENAVVASPTD